MNLLEMIVDCLKSCGGEASVSDLASAVGKTESEVTDILSSHENFFTKCENGNWKLTPLYIKDYLVASSYIGMEVIHSALTSTMSMGHGVVIDAFDNTLVVKFANKTAKLSFPTVFKQCLNPVDPAIKKRLSELGICNPDYSYLKFEVINGGYSVTGCTEDTVEASIPSKYKGLPVISIDCSAFKNCEKLESITIPESITEIKVDRYSFINCKFFSQFIVDEKNPKFTSKNGVLFSKSKKTLISYPSGKTDKFYIIDNTVETVAKSCRFSEHLKGLCFSKSVSKVYISLRTKKIYIPETFRAENYDELFADWYDDGGLSYDTEIVGGKRNSSIERYCCERNIPFIALENCEIKNFFITKTEDLLDRIKKQHENETEFTVSDGLNYEAKFKNGVLEVSALHNRAYASVEHIEKTINVHRREKVKEIIIGEGIVYLRDGAFHGTMNNLERIHIGKDVRVITNDAFLHPDWYTQSNFSALQSITVDEENEHYKSLDGILYTHDMKTLIRYPHAKQTPYLEINSNVGRRAFLDINPTSLACIKFGKGCSRIGEEAFQQFDGFLHVWFDRDTCEFDGYPFTVDVKRGTAWRRDDLVIGGYEDSYACKYFKDAGVYFLPIEDESEIEKFMDPSFQDESIWGYSIRDCMGKRDPYYAQCKKMLIMDRGGTVWQPGEPGEEYILPEGATSAGIPIDPRGVKKIHIPKTLKYFGTTFHKPGKDLQEITVAEGNQNYKTLGGHLYTMDNTLETYLPTTDKPGVIPDGTVKISPYAFNLLDKPLEKLFIPSSVKEIITWGCYYQNTAWFYDVEVSPDNEFYSSVDGNLTSKDQKTLIYKKVSKDLFTVPDGIEVLEEHSLSSAGIDIITIPASVREIKHSLYRSTICTTSETYAEAYAKENKAKLIVDGVLQEPEKTTSNQ